MGRATPLLTTWGCTLLAGGVDAAGISFAAPPDHNVAAIEMQGRKVLSRTGDVLTLHLPLRFAESAPSPAADDAVLNIERGATVVIEAGGAAASATALSLSTPSAGELLLSHEWVMAAGVEQCAPEVPEPAAAPASALYGDGDSVLSISPAGSGRAQLVFGADSGVPDAQLGVRADRAELEIVGRLFVATADGGRSEIRCDLENYGSASGWQTLAVTPLARIAKGQTYYVRISGTFCINRATPYGAASGTTGIGSTNGVTSSTAATVTAEGWFEGSSLASSWAGSHLGIQLFGSVVA